MAKKNVVLDPLIIEAARETFAKCGYKNATVREIAKRAGVTTGAIYTRYKGKEQFQKRQTIFLNFTIKCLKSLKNLINLRN